MTVSQVTSYHYLVRVYVKGMLCSFYVEAREYNAALDAGRLKVAEIEKLEGKAFNDYVVPGESRPRKRLDYLPLQRNI